MTDQRAAEAVGFNPDNATCTKSKPRVRAYMVEHRAAVEEKLPDQESDGLLGRNSGGKLGDVHHGYPERVHTLTI